MTMIECPNCGQQRQVKIEKAAPESSGDHPVIICRCGYTENAIIEKRKFKRHYFNASGSILFELDRGHSAKIPITVKDLSRSGIRFAIVNRTVLEADRKFIVTLEFKNNANTYFLKEATVINIRGKMVSAEFASLCGDIALLKSQAA